MKTQSLRRFESLRGCDVDQRVYLEQRQQLVRLAESRYVASRRRLSKPCYKCGKTFNPGDKVVARSKGRKTVERDVKYGLSVHYYHEGCWEKLFH